MLYTFDENNSGGRWWLNRKQYQALFDAGWKLDPEAKKDKDVGESLNTKDIPYEWRHGMQLEADSIEEAVKSWEAATGENFFAQGCSCCGAPFSIHSDNYNECISGSDVRVEYTRPF